MKKYYRFMLMALLVCGLSIAVTSCKDDDKNAAEVHDDMEQAESTGGDMTLAESQLASLISSFSGVQADELLEQSGWKSKTYEAELGVVLNESRPTVRSIEVGTLEEADEEACALLGMLGIDPQSPAGFTFADSEVGTVSYQHGGGADANTLAVINLDVKGLTGITQLQMVRALPANAGDAPRYKLGDIIRKKGDERLWVCVFPAQNVGGHAHFVTFWTDHPKGTCSWGKQNDVVYAAKKPMASARSLGAWMARILMDDANYNEMLTRLQDKGVEGRVEDLMPGNEEARKELIQTLRMKPSDYQDREPLSTFRIDDYKWSGIAGDATGRKVAPRGRLLCDIFRYSMGLTYDYWVPAVSWVNLTDSLEMLANLKGDGAPAQHEGKHFMYDMGNGLDVLTHYLTEAGINNYLIVKSAVHWQHKYFMLDVNDDGNLQKQWAIFDFTLDWKDWTAGTADDENWKEAKRSWTRRNITSSELVITDNGGSVRGYDDVWVSARDKKLDDADANDQSKIHINEVKMYSIIGTNGKFYDNVQAATDDGTEAMAIVTYLGENKRAERDKEWNGMAMALDQLADEYQFIDDDHDGEDCPVAYFQGSVAHKDFTGWATTQTLVGGCGKGHDHAAAKACHNYDKKPTARQSEFSSWFLPSFGQWILVANALGIQYRYTSDTDITFAGNGTMENGFKNAGVENLWLLLENVKSTTVGRNDFLMSSTSKDNSRSYNFKNSIRWDINDYNNLWANHKNWEFYVMPFIAFKYGGGGTQNQ